MVDDTLRSLRFRKEREESWQRLEKLVNRVERWGATTLNDEDMVAFPSLYRSALSSLSVARATSLDAALVEYLEALCARAYFFVYGTRTPLLERIGGFFAHDWPLAIRAIWRETLASLLLTVVAALTAYFLCMHDPDWYSSFVGADMAQGRDPSASTEALRETIYGGPKEQTGLGMFAAFLFTHNAQIALMAFALGFAFCFPTALLMALNGLMLGAMVFVFASRGLGYEFGGWLAIHGVTELFAVILAGAAGFRIGLAIAFPGELSRLAAAERAGRQGGVVMVGVVLMLAVAGILEGFARQLIVQDAARWSIAGISLVFWIGYFYLLPRRSAAHG